ncbi:MAG: sugar phosphate isomerase/epimerase [Planctomycetes bacterium]|nr:sugar phosphate isomerase/epimerase [Planctomycetota bacterium]
MDARQVCTNTASLPNHSLGDAIHRAKELGFHAIELLAFDGARHSQGQLAGFWFNRMTEAERDNLFRITRVFDRIAVHLPFFELPLFSYDPEMRAFCRQQLKIGIDGCAFLGATVGVVHAAARAGMACRDFWPLMLDTFRELADHAGERNVLLGVETGYPNTIRDFTHLIFDVDRTNFGAAIDVGHFRGYQDHEVRPESYGTPDAAEKYNDCLIETIEILGDRNVHFHLHDVRAEDWRDHRMVGTGIVDYPRLFDTLRKIGYRDLLSFELEEPNAIDALKQSKAFVERRIQN